MNKNDHNFSMYYEHKLLKEIQEKELILIEAQNKRDLKEKKWVQLIQDYKGEMRDEIHVAREDFSQADIAVIHAENNLKDLKRKLNNYQIEEKKLKKLEENPMYMLMKESHREIPARTFKHLLDSLIPLIESKPERIRIANEIVYAIKFGSLRFTPDNKEISIDYGINIALKMIRQTTWITPADIYSMIEINEDENNPTS